MDINEKVFKYAVMRMIFPAQLQKHLCLLY